jgi:hypothetical protein
LSGSFIEDLANGAGDSLRMVELDVVVAADDDDVLCIGEQLRQGVLNIAAGLDYQDGPIRDVLEELAARRVVTRHAGASEREDTWSLARWAHQRWDAVAPWLATEPPRPDELALDVAGESHADDADPLEDVDCAQGIGPYRHQQP